MNPLSQPALALVALTLLVGQVTDQTTGQPLAGVAVRIHSSASSKTATTDADGRFKLRDVHPGNYTADLSSNDVPPQKFTVHVHGAQQTITLQACSTTLDYHCPSGGGF
jgi:protocatechuate 3,4-dioxygenase beta subunit